MKLKKSILSFLLLFTYTIGFAHDFIPHYHIEDVHFGVGNHDHHSHVSENSNSTEIVEHGNHLDNGIYDYLVCIFSEGSHSNHGTKNDVFQSSINSIIHQPDTLLNEEFYIYLIKEIPLKVDSKFSTKPIRVQSNCLSSRSSRRGPPIFS